MTGAFQPATGPASAPVEPSPSELSRLVLRIAGQSDPQARLDAAAAILQTFSEEGVKALLDILATKNNDAAKLAVCQAISLKQAYYPAFIPPLLQLLDHKEPALSEAAAAALAGFHDPEVTIRLKEQAHQLLEKRFMEVSKQNYALLPTDADRVAMLQRSLKAALSLERVAALEIIHEKMSLGARPAPEILDQARQMLNDKDERVRQRLVVVLRDIRQPEDAPRVRGMLTGDDSPLVREEIYKALGYLGDPASIPACVAGLNEFSDAAAAQAAAALGRLAGKGQTGAPAEVAHAVTALLDRAAQPMDNPVLREQVIAAMSQIADPKFLPVLRDHADATEKVPAVRQAALVGIGQIGDAMQVSLVVDRLGSDPDPSVREVAADALGKLGSKPEHLEILRARLDPKVETSATVQNRAWEAYKLLFARVLSPVERETVLAMWEKTDPVTVGRRIELLASLEKQMAKTEADPQRLARVREQLGDAYLSAGRPADAAGVFAGVLDALLTATDMAPAERVAAKLLDAHLRTPSPDKAIGMISDMRNAALQQKLIGQLLDFVRQLAAGNPSQTAALLDRLGELVPNRFGPVWAGQFNAVRDSLPPATQPATTRPEGRRN